MTSSAEKARHTPTPWRSATAKETGGDPDAGLIICNAEGSSLGIMQPGDPFISADEAHANAAFISVACNAHDDLVAALECFLDDPRFDVAVGGNPIAVETMLASARAALAKAKAP